MPKLQSNDKFYRMILPNGLTLLYYKKKTPVFALFVATKFGAAYEKAENKGIAHFIEHMLFKGTKRRDQKKISYEIEKVGGELNGFTVEQFTTVYTRLPKRHFEIGMDVIFDMVSNSIFDKKEIEKERRVIFEEIKRKHDQPSLYIFDKIKECLYAPPFGLPVIGFQKTLAKIDRNELLNYFNYYSPNNLIVAVVSDLQPKEVFDKIKGIKTKRGRELPVVNYIERVRNYMEIRKDIQQLHLGIGFHVPSLNNKMRYAAEIFNNILGEGMHSRLFQEIREKRGLAYAVRSYLDQGKDYGYCCIYTGTKKEKLKEVKEIILKQISLMKDVTQREVEDAKENLIGSYEIENEDSTKIAVNLLENEIGYGDGKEYCRYTEKISKVKASEVREIGRIKNFSTVILGPK